MMRRAWVFAVLSASPLSASCGPAADPPLPQGEFQVFQTTRQDLMGALLTLDGEDLRLDFTEPDGSSVEVTYIFEAYVQAK